jgi:nucleolar protein 56
MTAARRLTLATTWFGAFLLEGSAVRASAPFPKDVSELQSRLDARREGRVIPEEQALVAQTSGAALVTRDRRLLALGATFEAVDEPQIDPGEFGFDSDTLRKLLLRRAEADLNTEWDPTVHVQEAVRALIDLDGLLNTVGERLSTWSEHDRPSGGEAEGAHLRLAKELAGDATGTGRVYAVPPADPALAKARSELAGLYLAVDRVHRELEDGLEAAMPAVAPNLTALLGASLAARMVSQAGSLERLARLPASTVQVLGAERAFFEHLRGRAPPPRHGLLFLHPRLHSAPRALRGRLARALAGKVSIAARLDRAGRPLHPELARQFESRAAAVRAAPPRGDRKLGRTRGSRPPLDRAAQHR